MDPWDRKSTLCCLTCCVYAPKEDSIGRCRRHAPTMQGYPVVYPHDWCGDHKFGSNPSKDAQGKTLTAGHLGGSVCKACFERSGINITGKEG